MMTDYWAHHYFDNPKAQEEVEDEDFNLEAKMAEIEAEAEGTTDWETLTADGN